MWSVVGTWFGGVVTVIAVGVALWIAHHDWRRADAERRDQERAQARLIVVDVDVGPIGPGGGVTMRVANHSDAPVFQVVGTFVGEYPSTWTERSQTADPVTVLGPGGVYRRRHENGGARRACRQAFQSSRATANHALRGVFRRRGRTAVAASKQRRAGTAHRRRARGRCRWSRPALNLVRLVRRRGKYLIPDPR
ncbi:MAG: hypothetical protein M3R63_20960 [Actinomycetota bacterium]|nr:hypothetical protein [Actinomycetota bacterium]